MQIVIRKCVPWYLVKTTWDLMNELSRSLTSEHLNTNIRQPMLKLKTQYGFHELFLNFFISNKGNAKCGVSPRLKIRPCDLDLWPWKSIEFQILLRSKYVPSLVKIHWRMLILVFTRMLHSKNLTQWHWPLTYDLENQ
jgi:hypothetical protein